MKNRHALSLAAMSLAFTRHNGPHFVLDYPAATGYPDPLVSNAPGIELEILYAAKRDFTTLQDFDTVTTLADIGKISANHTFASSKGFSKLTVLPASGNVAWTSTAPNGGAYKLNSAFKTKGNDPATRGLIVQMQNDDMVFLIQAKDGQWLQVGGKKAKAKLTPNFDSLNDEATEDVGIMFTIECFEKYPAYYTGTRTLKS